MIVRGHMPIHEPDGLRIRRCNNPECHAVFALCRGCDRGQRYCGDICRQQVRRKQVASAGQRYQSSEAGKQAHGRRQRAYHERSSPPPVTHQTPLPITGPLEIPVRSLTQCVICGRINRWHNPFDGLPKAGTRRCRPRRRPPDQISTFLHDR
jgi:hypothetical protein